MTDTPNICSAPSGLRRAPSTATQGCALGYRVAHLRCCKSVRIHRAITLLELLLALSLTVLVMMAIGMAININLRTLDTRRANVEQSQLARAVLKMISDDLRNAVQFQKIDFESAKKLAKSSAASLTAGIPGATPPTGNQPSGSTPTNDPSTTTDPNAKTDPAATTSSGGTGHPGLFGTQSELQVDVSRLPRVDEYSSLASPTGSDAMLDIPSDVKTIAYFVKGDAASPATGGNGFSAPLSATQHVTTGSGLVRRSLSRLVSSWALENGNLSSLENTGEIVAPEVSALEFRYFDGTEWVTEWDSDERNGLPVAIEILVAIRPREDAFNGSQSTIHRLVVHIPVGEPTTLETTETESSATAPEAGS